MSLSFTLDVNGLKEFQYNTVECINRSTAALVELGIMRSEIQTQLEPQSNRVCIFARNHRLGFVIGWAVENSGIRVVATPMKAIDFL